MAPSSHATGGIGSFRPSTVCETGSVSGIHRWVTDSPTAASTTIASIAEVAQTVLVADQPGTESTTAPPNEPMLQNAWNRPISGISRAFSTATPSAFIATSVAPLPRPRRMRPRRRAGTSRRTPGRPPRRSSPAARSA